MRKDLFVVELETGVWFAEGEGDPARVNTQAFAKQFDRFKDANTARNDARKRYKFFNAVIRRVD